MKTNKQTNNDLNLVVAKCERNKLENKMFDITASIERQFTRDGQKVLAIYDSGLDCKFPISAWFQGWSQALSLCSDGSEISADVKSNYDIITRPELLPLVITFHNVYRLTTNRAVLHDSLGVCEAHRFFDDILASVKVTFDPNTGISTAETVWQKEAE